MRSTWREPFFGGTIASMRSVKSSMPTRSFERIAENASVAAISATSSRLSCARVPKASEPDRSTASITVSSRSSRNTLTCGSPTRALTFQSIERTSSPYMYGRTSSNSMPRPLNAERYWPASTSLTMRLVRISIERIFRRISVGSMRLARASPYGTATCSRRMRTRSSPLFSSASASKLGTSRWRSTIGATSFTSCGTV